MQGHQTDPSISDQDSRNMQHDVTDLEADIAVRSISASSNSSLYQPQQQQLQQQQQQQQPSKGLRSLLAYEGEGVGVFAHACFSHSLCQ